MNIVHITENLIFYNYEEDNNRIYISEVSEQKETDTINEGEFGFISKRKDNKLVFKMTEDIYIPMSYLIDIVEFMKNMGE